MRNSADKYIFKRVTAILCVLFFVFISGGSLHAQTYGNVWQKGNLENEITLRDVVFTGQNFVAVGDSTVVYTSTDGATWTARSSGYAYNAWAHLFGVTYGNGLVIAVGRDKLIMSSNDNGVTWKTVNPRSTDVYDEDISKVAYGNGVFVACGESGGRWTSSNGSEWKESSFGIGTRCVAFGGGQFLVGATNGSIYSSTDGNTWTSVYIGTHIVSLAYGNGTWMAVGSNIWTSTNGTTWTKQLDIDACKWLFYSAVITDDGSMIAAGENGQILNSADGVTWRDADSASMRIMFGSAYGNDVVVCVSTGGPRTPDSLFLHSTHYSTAGGSPPTAFAGCGSTGSDSLRLTSPNGGEQWPVGSTQTITWSSTGSVGNVKIRYSTDSGTTWTKFEQATPNDGSYSWEVPDDIASTCRIKISETADGNVYDTSDSNFSIVEPDNSTITITYPNGGETLTAGSKVTATWASTGSIANCKLRYSPDNGTTWIKFEDSTPNDGSYSWTVPDIESSNCLFRASDTSDGYPTDNSDAVFTIAQVTGPTITVTDPNGGEKWQVGTNHDITWNTSETVNSVDIEYSADNGSSWSTVASGTEDDGTYTWSLPSTSTTGGLIRLTANHSEGTSTDTSNASFTIIPTLTVNSPNGGEQLAVGTVHSITWASAGGVGDVKLEYSINNGSTWTLIKSATSDDGLFGWVVPDTESASCLIKISQLGGTQISDISNGTFEIGGEPEIALDKSSFSFGYSMGGSAPTAQYLTISNNAGGSLSWTATSTAAWLSLSPASGNGGAVVTVTVDPTGLAAGTYTASISVADGNAANSPQTASVSLSVVEASQDQPPFGELATPADGVTARGAIPVTGWALDDAGIAKAEVFYGQNSRLGDVVFVDGARDDIAGAYPDYPQNTRAGWGYMLLTNSLPDGAYSIYVVVTDTAGHTTTLGPASITVDNANATKPFGTIDTPSQGGDASGANYPNWGWVLTPQPNTIPINGSTIKVWVNGEPLGTISQYNLPNEVLTGIFPGYNNSNGLVGLHYLDTTKYANGAHYIAWTVSDDAGNSEGIGSRFFTIRNISSREGEAQTASIKAAAPENHTLPMPTFKEMKQLENISLSTYRAEISKGTNDSPPTMEVNTGAFEVQAVELERIAVTFDNNFNLRNGYRVKGDELLPLPIGSTVKIEKNAFYWQPGPGFLGTYNLVLMGVDAEGTPVQKQLKVNISPKLKVQ
ncbi:MAG: hypothetical protein GY765_16220 [bacterium]|nr:hypothetical protein [bacterium]